MEKTLQIELIYDLEKAIIEREKANLRGMDVSYRQEKDDRVKAIRARLLEGRGIDEGVTRPKWTWIEGHWKFHAAQGSATVWPNGVWSTWDSEGTGGENAADPTIQKAMDEAEAAIVRQGWDKEPEEYQDTPAGLADFETLEETIFRFEDDGEISRLRMEDGRAAWERIKSNLGITIKVEGSKGTD